LRRITDLFFGEKWSWRPKNLNEDFDIEISLRQRFLWRHGEALKNYLILGSTS
jgi:hypothetical protein